MKTIDATNKSLGRVASEAAMVLMGKDKPTYQPNSLCGTPVHISNAAQLNLTDKKKDQKEYDRFTGHPGGRKILTMQEVIEKKGYAEVLRKAVQGMIPANRLRKDILKSLTISE